MRLLRQLVGRPEEADLARGSELVRKAQMTGAKTRRESDYIDALAVFCALSLLTWDLDTDLLANRKKAITILSQVFEESPDDPGAAHYLIHASDAPQVAQLGLPAARRYAQIAPAAPHALHMPSHIFARLGLWQEDIQSNLASLAAARQAAGLHVGAENQIHAMEFLEYAYLQIGEERKAEAMVADFGRIPSYS